MPASPTAAEAPSDAAARRQAGRPAHGRGADTPAALARPGAAGGDLDQLAQ